MAGEPGCTGNAPGPGLSMSLKFVLIGSKTPEHDQLAGSIATLTKTPWSVDVYDSLSGFSQAIAGRQTTRSDAVNCLVIELSALGERTRPSPQTRQEICDICARHPNAVVILGVAAVAETAAIELLPKGVTDYYMNGEMSPVVQARLATRITLRLSEISNTQRLIDPAQPFVKTLIHDLKGLTRRILMMSDYLAEDVDLSLFDGAQSSLDVITRSAQALADLAEGVGDYLLNAALTEPLQSVDLTALVQSVVEDIEPRLESAAIGIKLSPLPTVRCDPAKLARAFQALIDNVIIHSGSPRPGSLGPDRLGQSDAASCTVTISAEIEEQTAIVTVADTGSGIPDGRFDEMFQPLVRLHVNQERARMGTGAGLGLAMCDEIIKAHGGRIWASATPGGGCSIHIGFVY